MAHSIPRSEHSPGGDGCLGRTCMKWGADGELTDLDFQLILQRLGAVDAALGHELADEAPGSALQRAS